MIFINAFFCFYSVSKQLDADGFERTKIDDVTEPVNMICGSVKLREQNKYILLIK